MRGAMLVATLAFLMTMTTTARAAPVTSGVKAPGFSLPTQDGKPFSLDDAKGKWVVLYFYPKDFTGGCTLEAHNFERDLAQYEKRGAMIVGVSTQDSKSHKEFCVKEKLSFKLLADVDGAVSKKYEAATDLMVTVFSKRMTFLIDPTGVVSQVYNDVAPASHSTEVLKDLDALIAKRTPPVAAPAAAPPVTK
jgi:peroxiredoxin Q/BCP